jgi:hypothetical protein
MAAGCAARSKATAAPSTSATPSRPITWPTRSRDLLPGGKCWGDVAFMFGDTMFDTLCEGGEDGLWAALEQLHRTSFQPEEASA